MIAFKIVHGQFEDNTYGSTHYHADYVNPKWASEMTHTVTIGNHIFLPLSMNLYLDTTYDFNFFSEGICLGHYQDALFNYFDDLVDNSLIFNITFFSQKTLSLLKRLI